MQTETESPHGGVWNRIEHACVKTTVVAHLELRTFRRAHDRMLEVAQNCSRRNISPVFFVCKTLQCLTKNNDQVELTLLEELQVAMREEHAAESSGHAVVRTTKVHTSETSYRAHVSAPWQDLSHQDPHYFDKVCSDVSRHLQEYRVQLSETKLWHTFDDELSIPARSDIAPVSETESEKMRSCGGSHPCVNGQVWECGGNDRQGPKTRGGCVQCRKLKQSFMTPSWQTSSHSGPNPQRSH